MPKFHHHLAEAASFSRHRLASTLSEVNGVNAKLAIIITAVLGSMAFFWFSNFLAFVSLPAVLTLVVPSLKATFPAWLIKASLISLVSWIAQTYIQLVALPVLQVSNNAQAHQQDASTKVLLEDGATTRSHTEEIIGLLDAHTEGGLGEVMRELGDLKTLVGGSGSIPPD